MSAERQLALLQWSIFADQDGNQMFGMPVRITVEWPKGLPNGFATAAEFRDFARQKVAELNGASPMRVKMTEPVDWWNHKPRSQT